MYNNRVKNLELPENLFSNLGEIKSRAIERNVISSPKPTETIINNYSYDTNVKLTNYSNRKEYRDRIDKMYEDIKEIVPIDNEIDNILYFNNYVEKGIVVKPKVSSLKQFWTEYRLINNEKIEKKFKSSSQSQQQLQVKPHEFRTKDKELDSFDQLFEALSERVTEINNYIDELKEMRASIDKRSQKLEADKQKLASDRAEFNTYKQKEETKLNKEKENLKINFSRLQTIIDDLDKKLVSIDKEN